MVLQTQKGNNMKDAKRKVYICAVTLEHVQFIGPFVSQQAAGTWGSNHLYNPCWNTVMLFSHDVAIPLELIEP